MGYTFIIGNVEAGELECEDGRYAVPLTIQTMHGIKGAPRSENGNEGWNRWGASYGALAAMSREAGLDVLFRWETGEARGEWLEDHPGVFRIEPYHVVLIRNARNLYVQRRDQDSDTLAFLEWLIFWSNWALTNCKNPAIKND